MNSGYQKKIVSFIDVLGFKNLIQKGQPDFSRLDVLIGLFRCVSGVKDSIKGSRSKLNTGEIADGTRIDMLNDVEVQVFSDCVLMTATPDRYGLTAITGVNAIVYWLLFSHGYWARGGVTIGDIYHEGDIAIGPALIEAYELEDDVAIYPRIVLSKKLRSDPSWKGAEIPVRDDFDGICVLDLFGKHAVRMAEFWNATDAECPIDFQKGRDLLVKEFDDSTTEKVRSKLGWLKKEVNQNKEILGVRTL